MASRNSAHTRRLSDTFIAERLQSILINASEGRRSVSDDSQYPNLRREFVRRVTDAPSLLVTHPTVDSFNASIRGIRDKSARVRKVRSEFSRFLGRSSDDLNDRILAKSWTGIESPVERLRIVRHLLPLAQAAVEGMIATLSDTGGNGAPLLDEKEEAVDNLRKLHSALGNLLAAAESGHLDDALGQGFAAEAARYAKRTAKALRDDPMPYVASGLLNGVLAVCGLPGIGGFLGGIAQNIQKNVTDRAFRQ